MPVQKQDTLKYSQEIQKIPVEKVSPQHPGEDSLQALQKEVCIYRVK